MTGRDRCGGAELGDHGVFRGRPTLQARILHSHPGLDPGLISSREEMPAPGITHGKQRRTGKIAVRTYLKKRTDRISPASGITKEKKLVPGFPMLGKALPAVDRSPLSRLEGHFTFFTAVRTDCLVHIAGAAGEVVSTPLATKSVAVHYATYAVGCCNNHLSPQYKYSCMTPKYPESQQIRTVQA